MIPLDTLRLPDELLQKIRAAGYKSVWDLHVSNKFTLRIRSHLSISTEDVNQIIAAMRAVGWDFVGPCEDPVGTENFPSAVAWREMLKKLRLHPRSSRNLSFYLRDVCSVEELLAWIEPDDTETITQLLRLMNVEGI